MVLSVWDTSCRARRPDTSGRTGTLFGALDAACAGAGGAVGCHGEVAPGAAEWEEGEEHGLGGFVV